MTFTVKCAICLYVISCVASAATIKSCDQDSTKKIAVVLDDKTSMVSRYFCVVSESLVTKLVADSTDLTSSNASSTIDQSNVRLAQETSLQAAQDTKVLLNVGGLTTPGVYRGTVEFRAATMRRSSGATFTLEVKVLPKPRISILPANPTLGHVRCDFDWTCTLFGWLTSQSLVGRVTSVAVANQARGSVEIEGIALAVRGDHTGDVLTDASWQPNSRAFVTQEAQTTVVNLTLPANVGSDKYVGNLRINVKNLEDAVSTPLVLNVRDGPILPLIIIVVGISMGRIVQITNSPRLQVQTRLLQYLYVLEYAAQSISDLAVLQYLRGKFAEARDSIELATEADTQAAHKLDAIRSSLQIWGSIQRARDAIASVSDPARKTSLSQQADSAVQSLLSDDLTNAQSKLAVLQQSLNTPTIDTLGGSLAKLPVTIGQGTNRVPGGVEKVLLYVSGGLPVNAETAYRYLIPFGFVILLATLVVFGYYNFYLRSGDTFGAGGASDYLPLFFWGFSVDIAQRTLQMTPIIRS